MKLVSWNVAGLRACLKKGFNDFFDEINADIICLQEVKATSNQYDFHPEGYFEYLFPAERKGYSGTLIFSKIKPLQVVYGINNHKFDIEGRAITLEYNDFYLVNLYVPNVKRSLERMDERMEWEEIIKTYLKNLDKVKPVIICGDFNVAHTEIDIKNAKQNIGNAGFSYFNKDTKDKYTWWSYMKGVRERNIGWRIDYFLVSNRFIKNVKEALIYSDIYGSDHCPIGIEVIN